MNSNFKVTGHFVNFYADNSGEIIPTMLRIKLYNVPNNVKLAVFFDQSLSLDGYLDSSDNSYPCRIIVDN